MSYVDLIMEMQNFSQMTSSMNIPKDKKMDWSWLKENLEKNNSNHPKIQGAMASLKEIIERLANK